MFKLFHKKEKKAVEELKKEWESRPKLGSKESVRAHLLDTYKDLKGFQKEEFEAALALWDKDEHEFHMCPFTEEEYDKLDKEYDEVSDRALKTQAKEDLRAYYKMKLMFDEWIVATDYYEAEKMEGNDKTYRLTIMWFHKFDYYTSQAVLNSRRLN